MSIRRRTVLSVLVVLVLLVGALILLAQFVLGDSYAQLEQARVQQNLLRVDNALEAEYEKLQTLNRDWAHWDTSYAFSQGQDAEFVTRELQDEIMKNIGINYVLIVDVNKQKLADKALDLSTGESLPTPEGLAEYLQQSAYFEQYPEDTVSLTGLITVNERPMLVSSARILTSAQSGPAGGIMFFGRYLDAMLIADISTALDLSLSAYPAQMDALPTSIRGSAQSQALLSTGQHLIHELSNETIEGYTLVSSIDGTPALVIGVQMLRDIYQQGRTTVALFIGVFSLGGLIVAGALVGILERNVLRPLADLSAQVRQINANREGERLKIANNDEIGLLGRAINDALARLDESRQTIRQNEERLRTIVSSAPVLIWLVTPDERISLIQGSSVETLGLQNVALVGKHVDEVAERLGIDLGALRQALNNSEQSAMQTIGETMFTTRYKPLHAPDGSVSGVIGVATDVTRSRQSAEQLQDAFETIEQKSRNFARAKVLIEGTLEQLADALSRTAPRDELKQYVRFAQDRLQELN